MARKAASSIDKAVDRVGYWHGTWRILRDNWQGLGAAGLTFGITTVAAIREAWRYIQMMAVNVGGWIYPFTAAMVIFALIGVFLVVLLISRWFRGVSAIGEVRKQLASETGLVTGNDWANGLTAISLRDAACALSNIQIAEFGDSSRAKAIFSELASLYSGGWIEGASEINERLSGPSLATISRPGAPPFPAKPHPEEDVMIGVRQLLEIGRDRGFDTSWISSEA